MQVALVHVESLLRPEAGNKRIGVTEDNHFYQEFLDIIHDSPAMVQGFPNANWGTPGLRDTSPLLRQDATESKAIFGLKYRTIQETALDAAESLLKWSTELNWEK